MCHIPLTQLIRGEWRRGLNYRHCINCHVAKILKKTCFVQFVTASEVVILIQHVESTCFCIISRPTKSCSQGLFMKLCLLVTPIMILKWNEIFPQNCCLDVEVQRTGAVNLLKLKVELHAVLTLTLTLQVINAARTLAARPRSQVARENMDVFRTSWETQVHLLVDAVDEITNVDEFLAVSG